MEPLSLTAGAIATLIFSKALEKGGKKLGEAVSDKIGQLINLIRDKFKKQGMEGALVQAETNPTEDSQKFFQQVLEMQMTSDSEFAQKLKTLMDELKSDERVNQIFFKGVNVKGSAEIGDVEQTTTRGGSVTQEAVTGVEVGIVGEPGAGKTTLLTKIADWIDKNEKGLPIYISLANLQKKNLEEYLLEVWLEEALNCIDDSEARRYKKAVGESLKERFRAGGVWLLLQGKRI